MAYYLHDDGVPPNQGRGSAAQIRNEFDKIAAGFGALPTPAQLATNSYGYGVDTGGVNAFFLTGFPGVTAYTAGMQVRFKAANTNTGASTINVNAVGAVAVTRTDGSVLRASDIYGGQIATLTYSDTANAFQYQSSGDGAAASASASAQAAALSAASASSSQTAASSSASTASTSASNASSSATSASNSQGAAAGSVTAASTSATNAGNSATAAAASALSAVNAPGTSGTSTSSFTVSTGTKTFTTQTGKAWQPGQPVVIARTSNPTGVQMYGVISAYNSGTGAMSVLVTPGFVQGSGTYNDWTIALTGPIRSFLEPIVALAGGAIDASLGANFSETVAGARTFTFTNLPAAGTNWSAALEINFASGSISFAAAVVWPNGFAPTFSTGKRHRVFFTLSVNGTSIDANYLPNLA